MSEAGTGDFEDPDRRVAPRLRTLKRARVLFNNRFSTIDCIVRNVSRTGALLTVDTAVHLPRVFEISVGEEEIRPARLVYRREMFTGIRFMDVEAEEDLPQGASLAMAAGRADADEAGGEPTIEIVPIVPARLPVALTRCLPWARYRT